ncbi:esterase family protein [candidate division KSB1 bacterium]|nr:esterase family protein [candidate division KSB1 bacterium]
MKVKISYCMVVVVLLLFNNSSSQSTPMGKVLESLTCKSKLLKHDVEYSIYLPPDYDISSRRYPVVYLLHGFTDDEIAWVQFGEVNRLADIAIATGEIPPMIIAMPDAGVTWYINDYANNEPYEDFFIQEFIPFIDKTYRTHPEKRYRGVSGLSMGGHGALMYAMRHPELFAGCAAFSAGIYTDEAFVALPDESYDRVFGSLFGEKLRGNDRVNEHWHAYSPVYLTSTLPVEQLKQVRWYIDCGDDDFLYEGNSTLHITLRKRNVPHEYRVHDGIHNWPYWRAHIITGLKFIGESFHQF